MLNVVALQGRLTKDPELRTTSNGTSVSVFTLAVDRSYAPKGEERKADFVTVVAWRNTAEFVNKYFTKGQMMAVSGSIQTRNYEDKNGNKRTAVEVLANEVNFCGDKREAAPETRGEPQYQAPPQQPAQFDDYDDLSDDDLPFN